MANATANNKVSFTKPEIYGVEKVLVRMVWILVLAVLVLAFVFGVQAFGDYASDHPLKAFASFSVGVFMSALLGFVVFYHKFMDED